jgi:demethylmenaquinone methyltransferase / 2-methoxy-6-polyprenyl-1,4-benzoquinol methylase
MPTVGGLLTGNRAAYKYLPRTAAAFPAGDRFLGLMDDAGAFRERSARAFTGGITWLYRGVVAG